MAFNVVDVAPDRESQIELLQRQGFTRSRAEMAVDTQWAGTLSTPQNVDPGYPKEGSIVPVVAKNEYGKEIAIDTKMPPLK